MPTKDKGEQTRVRAWPLPQLDRRLLLIAGVALVLLALFPFWGSIAVAAVFAFGTYPLIPWLQKRVGGKSPRLLVGLSVAAFVVLMLLPVTLFGLRLYTLATVPKNGQATGLFSAQTISEVSAAKEKVEAGLITYAVKAKVFESEEEATESIQSGSKEILAGTFAVASRFFASLPEIFLELLVFCLFLYLFLSRAGKIRASSIKLGVVAAYDVDRIIHVMKASCYNSLISSFLIGLVQASVLAVGALFGGFTEFTLIFSAVFVFSFIPLIGTAPWGFLLAAISLLNHNTGSAIILLVTGILSGTIDNVIRPYIVARGENKVNPVLSFAVIIGAIGILGIKGIFLGPVIVTATMGFLNLSPSTEESKTLKQAS
ncbi:MAG: AI-2E family transporter [Bdellovibrionota bacterium]